MLRRLDCRLRTGPRRSRGGLALVGELVEGIGGDADASLGTRTEPDVAKMALAHEVIDESAPAAQRLGYLVGR